ncbi:glycosyltransferase N-terminal domain-containing protein, partial [Rhizobium leguminosarum]
GRTVLVLPPDLGRLVEEAESDGARLSRSIAESEIWPATVLELGRRRIPQILINARMSDSSFARWRRRPAIAEALFENLALVIA